MSQVKTRTIEDLVEDGQVEGSIYEQYNDEQKIIVYNGYQSEDEDLAIVEAYCEKNGYTYQFNDEVYIDYNMNIAYTDSTDIVHIEGELIGRKGFEDGDYNLESIENEFVFSKQDVSNGKTVPSTVFRALPTWYNEKELIEKGWIKKSCEFNNGMYEHNTNDEPSDILEKIIANEEETLVIFAVDSCNPFEVNFCVFTKLND
jgi:hypothetical protein